MKLSKEIWALLSAIANIALFLSYMIGSRYLYTYNRNGGLEIGESSGCYCRCGGHCH